jgi:hypothetical protein
VLFQLLLELTVISICFFARYGFQNSFQNATNPMDAGENAILFLLNSFALS